MGVLSILADVLFVGHSLVGLDLPPMVEAALGQMNTPSVVEAQVIDGAPLSYNLQHAASAQGVDAPARLKARPADVLILAEAEPIAAHIAYSDTAGSIAAFTALAVEANPEVRVFVYEVWPSLASGPGAVIEGDAGAGTPWRERITNDLPLWQGAVTAAAAKSGHDIALIPAGQAMGHLADEIAAGNVPGITAINEMFSDDIHPNGKGLYFLAVLHAAAITGASPEGLPAKLTRRWASRDAVLTDDQARALQRIAWQSLQGYVPAPGTPITVADTTPTAAEAPAAIALVPQPPPVFKPITNPRLTLGLNGINDWTVEQPFLDVMKTARPWVGHLPGQWGGWDHAMLAKAGYLGPGGWPKAIPPELTGISTLIFTDLPADAGLIAGRYVMTYDGEGTFVLVGRAAIVERGKGRVVFDYTPGRDAVLLTISAIDPADPIRNIRVVREDRAAALAAGQIFNPDWLARLRGVQGIRFMDWMGTNESPVAHSADRPMPQDYTWARVGVPMEVLVALANELNADPWFTVPHLADDDLVRTLAQIAEAGLKPDLHASVEYSNEVWNQIFAQARWADAQAQTLWGQPNSGDQFYGMRAAQVANIWAEVFAATPARLIRVIGVQTGWLGRETNMLDAPLAVAAGARPPVESFDAYAVTGYFSAGLGSDQKRDMVKGWLAQSQKAAEDAAAALGLRGAEADAYVAQHRFDLATELAAQELQSGAISGDPADSLAHLLGEVLPYHAAVTADRGLKLVMYEGGSHVVGLGAQVDDPDLTAFFIHLNYSAEMGALYDTLLAGWQVQSDAPFNAFVDVATPSKWGSWGALRHLADDNPRWQALARGCTAC